MAASMTIRFRVDPKTGERSIIISYESDADALPMEHEEEHRNLMEKLLEEGLITAEEAGTITVEREPIEKSSEEVSRPKAEAQETRRTVKENA